VGDEILKTLQTVLLIAGVCFSMLEAKDALSLGNDIKAYDQIFEKIAERRVGVSLLDIEKMDNPFVIQRGDSSADGNASNAQPTLILEATFDEKAKINGVWYKKNEIIGNNTLIKVYSNRVILQNETEKKELYIRTKDDSNFKISYK